MENNITTENNNIPINDNTIPPTEQLNELYTETLLEDDPSQTQEATSQPEFASAEQTTIPVTETTPQPSEVKGKKKVNKTLIIVLIFIVIFGGAMFLMNQGNNPKQNPTNNDNKEENKIEVNVGTEWGNKYLTYMLEKKPELKTYEISFIDVDYNETPEMFLKYIDNSNAETLKILYIAEDGYVYETKYYHDYRIRYIYSLKEKNTNWYLYLTTNKNYGTYTMISKILDEMAFDADIKTTNDTLLIEYGKKYYDTDYQPVFYNIKTDSQEDDFKDFVSKYNKYNEKVAETKKQVESKYQDYEYKEEEKPTNDTVTLAGRTFKFGNYYGNVPANEHEGTEAYIGVITLNNDGTIVYNGKLYTYKINIDDSELILSDNQQITIYPGKFYVKGIEYSHSSEQ